MAHNIEALERKNKLPQGLLSALIQAESGWNPNAVSPRGAQGLAQFMPATAKQYGVDPFDPESSIRGASQMLGDLNRKYQGDIPSVLAAYNWGQGNVDRKGLQNAPKETRNYIDKILKVVNPIGSAEASEKPYKPTRAEFLEMKRAGKLPAQQIDPTLSEPPETAPTSKKPTRAEFLEMKQAGKLPTQQINPTIVPQQPPAVIPEPHRTRRTPPNPETYDPSMLKNALYGFAGRGSQAIGAMNPFADQERLAAERRWMENAPGAGVGSSIADMFITAPVAAVPGGLAARAAATGLIEGSTRPGTGKERLYSMGTGAVGSAVGEGVAKGVGALVKPFAKIPNTMREESIEYAKEIGMPLSAKDITGNRSLQNIDAVLDDLPFSSSMQASKKEAQRKIWQTELLRKIGVYETEATPQVVGAAKRSLSDSYEDIASRNVLNVDAQFKRELNRVRQDLLRRLPTNQRPIVQSYLDDFDTAPVGATIPGKTYQDTRSLLDKQAKSFQNDPTTSKALLDIRDAIDKAFNRSVSPNDAALLKETNRRWRAMRTIEDAIDPLSGDIVPGKLLRTLKKNEKNNLLYGTGDQGLNKLARAGQEFIGTKIPTSKTSERAFWQRMLTSPQSAGTLAGGLGAAGALGGPIGAAGALGIPPLVSRSMWKPGGYLSEGLADLNKEVLPGLTGQGLLDIMSREVGVAGTRRLGGQGQ